MEAIEEPGRLCSRIGPHRAVGPQHEKRHWGRTEDSALQRDAQEDGTCSSSLSLSDPTLHMHATSSEQPQPCFSHFTEEGGTASDGKLSSWSEADSNSIYIPGPKASVLSHHTVLGPAGPGPAVSVQQATKGIPKGGKWGQVNPQSEAFLLKSTSPVHEGRAVPETGGGQAV